MAENFSFAHHHIHSWAYVQEAYRHSVRMRPWVLAIWCALVVCSAAGAAICLAKAELRGFGIFYAALCLFCLYRGFFEARLRQRRNWKKTAALYGTEEIESTVRFGDTVQVEEGGRASFNLEWQCFEALVDQGDWLKLVHKGKQMSIYLKKSDFTVGTAAEFQDWLQREHPAVQQFRQGKQK